MIFVPYLLRDFGVGVYTQKIRKVFFDFTDYSSAVPAGMKKELVVLMDESSIRNSEFSTMDLRTGDNVVVLGNTSLGADGDELMEVTIN